MVGVRQTWEIDQEIVQLTRRKEQILRDLQEPRLGRKVGYSTAAAGSHSGLPSHLAGGGGRP